MSKKGIKRVLRGPGALVTALMIIINKAFTLKKTCKIQNTLFEELRYFFTSQKKTAQSASATIHLQYTCMIIRVMS